FLLRPGWRAQLRTLAPGLGRRIVKPDRRRVVHVIPRDQVFARAEELRWLDVVTPAGMDDGPNAEVAHAVRVLEDQSVNIALADGIAQRFAKIETDEVDLLVQVQALQHVEHAAGG